jgi:hypothetical protein
MKTQALLSRRALATTMSRLASTVPILVGGTILGLATPAHATTSNAVTCQTKKLAAVAKLYSGAQKCVALSLIHALPPNPCLQTIGSKFDAAFVKADTVGPCSGTASDIRPSVEAQALEVASLIGYPTTTTTSTTTTTTTPMGCPSGDVLCGSTCVDLANDPNNCGLCGNHCVGGFARLSGVCAGTCATDAQCASGFYCGGTPPLCIAQEATGATCSANDQCLSGTCSLATTPGTCL